MHYNLIETLKDLKKFTESIKNAKKIAVDMEADSMFHYENRVCLIQIGAMKKTALIDTIKVRNLDTLKPFFLDEKIEKIFHGADYDIRCLYRDFKIEINNLFDTELAARFLGIEHTNLKDMLKNYFDVETDKRFQKKDWSKRPLPKEMLDYAAKDASYLLKLSIILKDELKKRKKMAWVKDECENLSRVRFAQNDKEHLFLKFKGAGKLTRKELNILESILLFREKIAKKENLPPFKIFSNKSILNIIYKKVKTEEDIKKKIVSKNINKYREEIAKSIAKATKIKKEDSLVYPQNKKILNYNSTEIVKKIKSYIRKKAKELDIAEPMLLNRSQIFSIVKKLPNSLKELKDLNILKKWQFKIINKDLIKILKEYNKK